MFLRAWLFALLLLPASLAAAQAVPSAEKGNSSLWVGEAFSRFQPDYGPSALTGVAAFLDYNRGRWGLELKARFLQFGSVQGETQSDYLAGPRLLVWRRRRFRPFAGLLLGTGTMQFPSPIGTGSYFIYAPLGGAEYRVSGRVAVRGDYEYQFWPKAPGIPGEPSHGLNPAGVTAGVSFRLF